MRGVRHLGGLAGNGASLANAGASGTATGPTLVDTACMWQAEAGSANDYRVTVDVSGLGIQSGDLIIAAAVADSSFDSPSTYISSSGFTTLATDSNKARWSYKVADGTEAEIVGEDCRLGGVWIYTIRGVVEPSAADIADAKAVYASSAASGVNAPVMTHSDYDAMFFVSVTVGNGFAIPGTGIDAPMQTVIWSEGAGTGDKKSFATLYVGSGYAFSLTFTQMTASYSRKFCFRLGLRTS